MQEKREERRGWEKRRWKWRGLDIVVLDGKGDLQQIGWKAGKGRKQPGHTIAVAVEEG